MGGNRLNGHADSGGLDDAAEFELEGLINEDEEEGVGRKINGRGI